MPIQVLPQTLINQIAAGEVVVRMANVVKELVENSIDAGARRIEILITNDARDVEVRDDGCGMNRDDAELCLQRHATSKIRTVEDLFNLRTRGFRGEAIPSIASVSRMEIHTRRGDDLSGTRVVVEGGRIQRIESFGCPPGTRILIRDLFFNTPARLKFLKSIVSEANAILGTVTRQALAQPGIGFRIERDGREVMELPPEQSLPDRFASILGSQLKGELIPVDFERGTVRIRGILAHPHDARADRRSQYFFVNDRPFSSKQLVASLEQACKGYVMIGRHPLGCFFVEVPAEEVDFNVHPTKEEVRFQDERFIAGTLFHAVQQAFSGAGALVGEMRLAPEREPVGAALAAAPAPPLHFTSPDELVRRAFDRKQALQQDMLIPTRSTEPAPAPPPVRKGITRTAKHEDGTAISAGPGEQPDFEFWNTGHHPEPLGQIAETYVVVRYGEDMLLVDQHAAHERLVYLQLKRGTRVVHSQPLLIPITVELSPAQSEGLRGMLPVFAEMGFEVDEFGPRSWAINSLPTDLPEFDPVPMILDLIDDYEDAKRQNALEEIRDKILIRTACHSAIRAGARLTTEAMKELLAQMKVERLSLTCPHGRPTIVRLSKGELDRQFKRIV